MKKWIILVFAASLLGYVATAEVQWNPAKINVDVAWSAAGWIIIYIPDNDTHVVLGEIDGSLYDPVSGTWTSLTSDGHTVYVVTNAVNGFQLQITAALSTYPADHPNPNGILDRLTLSSVTMGISGGLNSSLTYTGSRGLFVARDIEYSFTPSFDDVPGDYSVTVVYTATAQ